MRVIIAGTAISFGICAAIVVSVRDFFGGDTTWELTWRTPVAFVAGALAGWLLWWIVGRLAARRN